MGCELVLLNASNLHLLLCQSNSTEKSILEVQGKKIWLLSFSLSPFSSSQTIVCMYLLCSHWTSRIQKFCCHNLQISGCTKTFWSARVSKLPSWQHRRLLVFALCCHGDHKCTSIVVLQVVLGGSFSRKFFFFLSGHWEGVMIVWFRLGKETRVSFMAIFWGFVIF